MMTPLDAKRARPIEGGASFSLGNRLFRVFWMTCWLVLARFTPPPLHPWRRLVLQAFGARLGRNVRIHASVSIWHPANLQCEEHVLIGPGVRIYNQGQVTIGARTVISQRAHLCASTHNPNDPHFQLLLRPIHIGEQCWIAAEAFVGPGSMVKDRAILGARACLFGDAEADGIYRGNPASFVKTRTLPAAPDDQKMR